MLFDGFFQLLLGLLASNLVLGALVFLDLLLLLGELLLVESLGRRKFGIGLRVRLFPVRGSLSPIRIRGGCGLRRGWGLGRTGS